MTPEEKAKAYDEAIKKATALYKTSEPMSGCNVIIETLFPELKESEDEKIRKDVLAFIRHEGQHIDKYKWPKWIAWLEKQGEKPIMNVPSKEVILAIWDLGNEWKELTNGSISTKYGTQLDYIQKHWEESEYYLRSIQGKQKPTNKVEPKFHEGDWIVNPRTGLIEHIKNVLLCGNNGNYEFESSSMSIDSVDNSFRLWTIQDAKDGDILSVDNRTFIYNGSKNEVTVGAYCGFNTKHIFSFAYDYVINQNIIPATKEQHDLLFQKMREAGYEWDANKKALITIKDDINKTKFNTGDWITNGIDVDKIIGIDLEDENYLFENGRKSDISLVNSNSHLWTIEDANDGDVLATEDKNFTTPFVAIFKERGLDFFNSYCFIGFDGNFYEGEVGHDIENIHPATKEQRNLLFQKMNKAGYEWDVKKKEVKKIKANEAMYDDDKLREAICE